MSYWICPLKKEYPIVVEAESHEDAKKQIAASPMFDGGQVLAIPMDFYVKLCKTSAVDAALVTFRGGQLR
jgi:hypothetical protein